MTTTRRITIVAAVLLVVVAAGFLGLYLLGGVGFFQFGAAPPDTTTTAAGPTTATTTATDAGTATTTADPDEPTSTVTVTTTATTADPDAPTTTPTTPVPAVTVPIPSEPDEWWAYNPELEWPVTDRDRLATGDVYPHGMIPAAVNVAERVEQFWSWYMTWGHPQGAALDLNQPDHRTWLDGDAVGQLMFIHHRFWQQRLPVWREVWNREFDKAREAQRNKLIYMDSLGEVSNDGVGEPTLLYNPAVEMSVWRYWGPIIRPVPNPKA